MARPRDLPVLRRDLEDPAPGFVDHLHERPACEAGVHAWRKRVVDDIGGEWSG